MNRKNLSDCFDLLGLATLLFVVAVGCGPKYRDDSDGRDRDFGAISAPKARPIDNQNQKPKQTPKPAKQRANH